MSSFRALDALSPREQEAAAVALLMKRCFPCGAACRPVGFGLFTHPSNSRSMVYPLCRTCTADYADPKQRQAFVEAVHRRFVKLGEVTP